MKTIPVVLYVRNDDPVEKVKIISQARTPNGRVNIEVVEPEDIKGLTKTYAHSNEFFAQHRREDDTPPKPADKRPPSWASKDEWRAYALYLENKLGLHKNPVMRGSSDAPRYKRVPLPSSATDAERARADEYRPEAYCGVCFGPKGRHCIGESCNGNDGGLVVANELEQEVHPDAAFYDGGRGLSSPGSSLVYNPRRRLKPLPDELAEDYQ